MSATKTVPRKITSPTLLQYIDVQLCNNPTLMTHISSLGFLRNRKGQLVCYSLPIEPNEQTIYVYLKYKYCFVKFTFDPHSHQISDILPFTTGFVHLKYISYQFTRQQIIDRVSWANTKNTRKSWDKSSVSVTLDSPCLPFQSWNDRLEMLIHRLRNENLAFEAIQSDVSAHLIMRLDAFGFGFFGNDLKIKLNQKIIEFLVRHAIALEVDTPQSLRKVTSL